MGERDQLLQQKTEAQHSYQKNMDKGREDNEKVRVCESVVCFCHVCLCVCKKERERGDFLNVCKSIQLLRSYHHR